VQKNFSSPWAKVVTERMWQPTRTKLSSSLHNSFRLFYNASPPFHRQPQSSSDQISQPTSPNTHFKITLRRSPIALGAQVKGTLVSLGIHRRMQTVYFPHSPIVAGKILRVKELVEVENVPAHAVRTKEEQRKKRQPPRGYRVVGSKLKKREKGIEDQLRGRDNTL
jgi:large subunit ribosomal protein L30